MVRVGMDIGRLALWHPAEANEPSNLLWVPWDRNPSLRISLSLQRSAVAWWGYTPLFPHGDRTSRAVSTFGS